MPFLFFEDEGANEVKNYTCPKCYGKEFKAYLATDNKVGLNKLRLL